MSQPLDPNSTISLHKAPGMPPDLPPVDRYGSLLPRLLASPRKCRAGAGISWLSKAIDMFKENFLLWLGMGLVFLIIVGLGGEIPFVGLFISLLSTVFIGGMIKGCAAQAQGDELRFDHLFSAFKTHFIALIKLVLLYVLGLIVAMMPMVFILGSSALFADSAGQELNNIALAPILLTLFLTFILMVPLFMALWFAPALIVLHDIKPLTAMKMSFKAGLANIIPMIVFVLILAIIVPLFVVVTLGFGILIVVSILVITYYTSYRDVWTDQPLSA